jgi:hypothetical protein
MATLALPLKLFTGKRNDFNSEENHVQVYAHLLTIINKLQKSLCVSREESG